MKKVFTIIFLLFGLLTISSQTATDKTDLQTPALDETSGLLFYNKILITHNDSGDDANLYEINTSTGNIIRMVEITNATNVDWEDITQDAAYIYVGDIGNNNGNRTDLKIYKISKDDYNDMDDIVTADIISYSYADQTDFTSNPTNTNWDAEGLISYGEKLLVFTKNWADNEVNVYSIPKTSGTHNASLESNYNVNGLITGVDISPNESEIYLTGYSSSEAPFMYTIHNIPNNSLDIFSGITSDKISNIVPIGNQVEAITLFEITTNKHRLYISNEKSVIRFGSATIPFTAKLWIIEIDTDTMTLNVPNIEADIALNIYPNPFNKILKLSKRVDEIIIYDLSGRRIIKQNFVEELSLENLNKGLYVAHFKINNSKFIRKIIKNK
ncbi:MAG: hypothetical protein ACJAYY_000401 [Paraglaciecola sp.]|jgi:hypothetical protein|uniref:T9SS type A sorting domain-containing protein n=1 Tax=Polaribacter sp. TaxID=1920175 RepID=UPI003AD689FB